jgi:hypothetical protein
MMKYNIINTEISGKLVKDNLSLVLNVYLHKNEFFVFLI